MHRMILTTAALCGLVAAACSDAPTTDTDTAKTPVTKTEKPVAKTPAADEGGPAGEIAPDSRAPTAESKLPAGVDPHFAPYFEKVPFTWGVDAGLAKAKAEGKPAMLFYTAMN